MRFGILYEKDVIEERGTVFDCMYSFINGRRFALAYGQPSLRPLYIVQKNEDGRWSKLKPTRKQINDCLSAVSTWQMYNQSERDYRA